MSRTATLFECRRQGLVAIGGQSAIRPAVGASSWPISPVMRRYSQKPEKNLAALQATMGGAKKNRWQVVECPDGATHFVQSRYQANGLRSHNFFEPLLFVANAPAVVLHPAKIQRWERSQKESRGVPFCVNDNAEAAWKVAFFPCHELTPHPYFYVQQITQNFNSKQQH